MKHLKMEKKIEAWKKGDLEFDKLPISKEATDEAKLKADLSGKSFYKLFLMFFDEEMLDLIVNYLLKYAAGRNCYDFRMTKTDLLKFLGKMIFSGYHTLPSYRMYWSKDEDEGVDLIKNSMSRKI